MATTRVFYKGKKELTMAQFEALISLDDAVDYNITDFPNSGITNAQMTAALGYSRLFEDGDVFVCLDNGTYTKGHTYQVKVTSGIKSWEDITILEKGNIKTVVYDNTTLADHINEILGYVNTENGGNLLNVNFKVASAVNGEMKTVTNTLSTNTLTNSTSTVAIINAEEMITLNVGTVRNGSTSGKKVTFTCANDTNICSFANVDLSNINGIPTATISGQEIDFGTGTIITNYFKGIDILNTTLEHLVINYYTI